MSKDRGLGVRETQTSFFLHALCKQTVDGGKLSPLLTFLFRSAHFPNVFLMTHLPGPRTCLIARHFHFHRHTHTEMQKTTTMHTQIYHRWQVLHTHTHTEARTLSSSSLPLGVNTFFYLVDIYRRGINISPFPLHPPFSPADCGQGWFVGWGWTISLSHHKAHRSVTPWMKVEQQRAAAASNRQTRFSKPAQRLARSRCLHRIGEKKGVSGQHWHFRRMLWRKTHLGG